MLRDAHLMTGLAQAAIHGLPPRTVDKTAVYKDYRFHCVPFRLLPVGWRRTLARAYGGGARGTPDAFSRLLPAPEDLAWKSAASTLSAHGSLERRGIACSSASSRSLVSPTGTPASSSVR